MKVIKTENKIKADLTANEAAKMFLKRLKNQPDPSSTWNRKVINERSDFVGSTLKKCIGIFTKTPPQPPKALLPKEQLQGMGGNITRRKRCLSEHDGDWDLERQWDIKPFSATKRVNENKLIMVDVYFNFSCMVQPEEIREYGKTVYATVQGLEKTGFQCGINLITHATDVGTIKGENIEMECTYRVKEPGQYQTALQIYKYFTPEFYRRIHFSMKFELIEEKYKGRVCGSLGRPTNPPSNKIEPGRITLTPGENKNMEFTVKHCIDIIRGYLKI